MVKKLLVSMLFLFTLSYSVHAEEVDIPTDGVRIEVERKALESDNLTGAVDIKIYNNTNQTIGIAISSEQSVGWLVDKEVEQEYRIGSVSNDYHTVVLYVKPHRFVTKTGYNIVMVEGKELLDKPVSINYSVFTDTDELGKVDINNQDNVKELLTKGIDNGSFNLGKDESDVFKNNLPVTETIEEDIKSILSPKEKKTISVQSNGLLVPIMIGVVVLGAVSGAGFIIYKKGVFKKK